MVHSEALTVAQRQKFGHHSWYEKELADYKKKVKLEDKEHMICQPKMRNYCTMGKKILFLQHQKD